MTVVVTFVHFCDQIADKSSLKKGRVSLSLSLGAWSIMTETAWQSSARQLIHHTASTVRKESKMKSGAQLIFSS